MNRRTFIKGLFGAAAAIGLPVTVLSTSRKEARMELDGAPLDLAALNSPLNLPTVTVNVNGVDQGPGEVSERFQQLLAGYPEMTRPSAYMQAILEFGMERIERDG